MKTVVFNKTSLRQYICDRKGYDSIKIKKCVFECKTKIKGIKLIVTKFTTCMKQRPWL